MKTDHDKPNRRTVTLLLDELGRRHWYSDDAEYKALDAEYDRLQEQFKKTPKMVALAKRIERLKDEHERRRNELEKRVRVVRRAYLGRGLTPAVMRMVSELVEFANKLQ